MCSDDVYKPYGDLVAINKDNLTAFPLQIRPSAHGQGEIAAADIL
jgi:hypothetical protein